ncbi:putative retrovirus-related Pol polyprotein from transposon [Apostichopus japonicus]|uniref:Putative retrovirus-related Pol polyprotein from transposon n=1 Tax=Stichopus japonicus TaxID=307972 RepID=A0A2G8K1Y0_STIJA|nr:putative retrovirus-related Pol polyprotein from transposon [Apostichopus japonicus]
MDDPVYDLILGNVPGVREPTDPDENLGKSVDIRDTHVSVIDENNDIKHEETNERQQDLGSAVQTRSQRREEDKPFQKLKVISPITEEVTADMLAKQQQEDTFLEKMRELAKTAVATPDGSRRVCFDARRINQVTVFDAEPIPDQEEIFAQLSKDKYFRKIDLSKGYWQIPMAKESKPLTAFVTNDGLYQFNTMPFGLVNAAATFSRVMRKLLRGLDNVHNYIDDILIHTETWESHLQKGVMKPKPDKLEAIQKAEQPTTKKQVRSFLGLAGYYRKFIPNFAAVTAPLTDCTKKGEPNVGAKNQDSISYVERTVVKITNFQLPDLNKEFTLKTDASDTGVGAILLQDIAGEMFPVTYASKKLNKCQKKYSVMKRECLAVVWAVRKFEPYLYGKEFTLETDHQPLICVRKSKVANGKIMRWALALQPYRFRLKVIKGAENV